MKRNELVTEDARPLRRVLILADESAEWRVAGLRQLDRLALSLQEFAHLRGTMEVCIFWDSPARPGVGSSAEMASLPALHFVGVEEFLQDVGAFDLVVSTHLFLHRGSLPRLLAELPVIERNGAALWNDYAQKFQSTLAASGSGRSPWCYLASEREIPACERVFLRGHGKSQDGLVSRHLNRRVSRALSRFLLKTPITPNAWSILIFALPLIASLAFLRGTYSGFIIGCAVFQLYSTLDGCDGEIARAKFLQTEFGRRLDSFLDLVGNLLLALTLGFGLARQSTGFHFIDGFYISEGIAAAILIALSEGIVFFRRTRSPASALTATTKWNGTLYQRHHEFLERSGILFLGERFAFWLVQLTKRDMAMLAFLILAIAGWPQLILHLLFAVAGISSVLAGNAYLRPGAARLASEAS